MKLSTTILACTFFVSMSVFAGDGAKNSTVIISNQANNSTNTAISGELDVSMFSIKGQGRANAGSVDLKGSVEDSTVIIDNQSNDSTNTAIGNAVAGGISVDFTN